MSVRLPKNTVADPPETSGSAKNRKDYLGPDALMERRRAPRHAIAATAEITELGSQTRAAGRCADLSLGGCYVDTISPFPVGTRVTLRLKRGEKSFVSPAHVVYSSVGMGMGLTFDEMAPEHRATLELWSAQLSGNLPPDAVPQEEETKSAAGLQNERHVLNQLIATLVRKGLLTENEGTALLRELFR